MTIVKLEGDRLRMIKKTELTKILIINHYKKKQL